MPACRLHPRCRLRRHYSDPLPALRASAVHAPEPRSVCQRTRGPGCPGGTWRAGALESTRCRRGTTPRPSRAFLCPPGAPDADKLNKQRRQHRDEVTEAADGLKNGGAFSSISGQILKRLNWRNATVFAPTISVVGPQLYKGKLEKKTLRFLLTINQRTSFD